MMDTGNKKLIKLKKENKLEIKNGNGTSKFGQGISINLDGCELATAIDAYLVSHNIHVSGARTITVNGDLCDNANIYVDPSGFVIHNGVKL